VALRSDGTVIQWGNDSVGNVPAGLSNVVAVAAGGTHSVALKADGTVVAWGENYYDQLDIPAGLTNVKAIVAAESQTLALKSDGTMLAWGTDYFGGNVTPPAELTNVVAIATSGTFSVAVVRTLPRPILDVASATASQLTLRLTGEQDRVYTIETSFDLLSWEPLLNVTNATGPSFFAVEKTSPNRQFFRAKTPAP
jgi:alpha-tubulin suppressor-like RCC1 family protein